MPIEDFDKPFVLKHSIRIIKGKPNPNKYEEDSVWFAAVFTTQRLLRNGLNAKVIQADSTYKIVYEGCPIQLFGTSDLNNKFHLIAIGFSSNENEETYQLGFEGIRDGMLDNLHEEAKFNVLVSDAAMAIKNAFNSVFPHANKTVTCWFHVKKNIRSKIENNRDEILGDIDKLQLCENEKLFDRACVLFTKKWRGVEKNFIDYFERQWLSPNNKFWFEGAEKDTPKTNNGIESTNGRLKSDFFFREKFTLPVFRSKIFGVLQTFSYEYRDGLKQINNQISFNNELWKNASKWASSEKKTIAVGGHGGATTYFIPAGEMVSVDAKDLKSYKSLDWKNFDDFKGIYFKIWRVFVPKKDSLEGTTCSCPAFLKKNKCKHVLAIGLRLHSVDEPESIRTIGKKRMTGRPKKIGRALALE